MTNNAYKEKNLYYLELYKKHHGKSHNDEIQMDDELTMAIWNKLREIVDTNERIKYQNESPPHIMELERKCEAMEKKLNKAVPYHSIIYMCVNSGIFSVSLVMLILRFVMKIYIVDPYYLICAVIISLGLFMTALVTLIDWKEYLKSEGEK